MPEHDFTRQPGRRGTRGRGRRDGSSVLAVLAGVAVLCVGTTAAALAAVHRPAEARPASQRQVTAGASVSVQAAGGTVQPGQAVPFSIQISPLSVLDEATVQISVTSSGQPAFPPPTFTSCGAGAGTQTCTLGLLQAGQATELQAQLIVPGSAPGGDSATLSATVSWALLGIIPGGSATGAATVSVVSSQPTPPVSTPPPSSPPPGGGHTGSPPPSGGHPGPPPGTQHGGPPHGHGPGGPASGSTGAGRRGATGSWLGARLGALALNRLPLLTLRGGGPAANPAGLFPRIYPSPLPAASGRSRRVPAAGRLYHATTVADILPLDVRQLGIQGAGLIVLALGIAMVVVRIPLRRRRGRHDAPVEAGPRRTDDI